MIREEIKISILKSVREKFGEIEVPSFSIAIPENPEHGDYASNVAMLLAKAVRQNPMEIATALAKAFSIQHSAFSIQVASPGFLNFYLSEESLRKEFFEILKKKEAYGKGKKQKKKIQVEFISANPTGPLTLANGRGGFFGDVLARVLEHQGSGVEREYYVNDTGNQVRTLGLSALAALGKVEFQDGFYRGDYISQWAKKNSKFVKKYESNPGAIGIKAAENFLTKLIRPAIEKKMKIKFDRWSSESAIVKKYLKPAATLFEKNNLIYVKDRAQWLKTTEFGDDKDRVIVTGDGFPTYFLNDAAHYLETASRGFSEKINILGADHHGYVLRIQAAAKIVGLPKSEILVLQLVRLMSKGQEVRMSKRKGVYITIDELIDEIGTDVARFFFLEKSLDTHMDFDLDLAKEHSQKNPVYYVQYAHARIASILRKLKAQNSKRKTTGQSSKLELLNTPEEKTLIKKLIQFPEVVEDIAHDYQVHRLPRYCLELARVFHNFYEKHRVITDDTQTTTARLQLVQATKIILQNSLGLLGIASPEKM